MSRKDRAVLIDEHRVGEAEGLDRLRDLAQLLLGMGPGILCPRPQAAWVEMFDVALSHD
jgi:hypothetical protein